MDGSFFSCGVETCVLGIQHETCTGEWESAARQCFEWGYFVHFIFFSLRRQCRSTWGSPWLFSPWQWRGERGERGLLERAGSICPRASRRLLQYGAVQCVMNVVISVRGTYGLPFILSNSDLCLGHASR